MEEEKPVALHVFTNGNEFYAARDMAHLAELVEKNTGMPLDAEDNVGDNGEWSQCPDDKLCKVRDDDDPDDKGEEKTYAEWAKEESHTGFLFATDF